MTHMRPNLTDAETALGGVLPHRRMEAWKYTDVRANMSGPNEVSSRSGLVSACVPHIDIPDGLTLTREPRSAKDTPMGGFSARFSGENYVINVPENFVSTQVLRISNLRSGHARISIKLGKNAVLAMSEIHDSEAASFVNIEMVFDLAEGAQLTRQILHTDHRDCTRIATSHISTWGDARLTQHTLSFGGALARFETRIAAMGANLNAEIHGAYLLDENRHVDMTSYIDLSNENAHIRQSVKGVVTDKARGVFQGKFHVRRPAQFTDAEMRHDALMLSDRCEIRAKPELEIYADDVACAHGNTIGALDESALFYMRQRGIPIGQARALLTQAFVADAFETMAESADFMSRISNWLEVRS